MTHRYGMYFHFGRTKVEELRAVNKTITLYHCKQCRQSISIDCFLSFLRDNVSFKWWNMCITRWDFIKLLRTYFHEAAHHTIMNFIYQYMYFIPTLSETYLKIYIIYKGIYPSAYLVRRLISEVLIHYHMFLYFHGKYVCSTFKYMCQFCTYFQVSC